MRRLLVLVALVAVPALALVALARSGPGAVAQDATPEAADPVVGSWVVTAQFPDGFSAVNFSTIMPGGVMLNTADDASTGHGAWERTGEGTYAITFVHPDFDDDGALEGRSTVRGTLTLGPDGDTFTSPFAVEVTDLAGTVLFSDTGTAEGERIGVEPPPTGTPAAGTPAA